MIESIKLSPSQEFNGKGEQVEISERERGGGDNGLFITLVL